MHPWGWQGRAGEVYRDVLGVSFASCHFGKGLRKISLTRLTELPPTKSNARKGLASSPCSEFRKCGSFVGFLQTGTALLSEVSRHGRLSTEYGGGTRLQALRTLELPLEYVA